MRLISYQDGAADRLAVEHGDGRIWSSQALGAGLPGAMAQLLAAGDASLELLRSAAQAAAAAGQPGDVEPSQRIAPVPRPGKYTPMVDAETGPINIDLHTIILPEVFRGPSASAHGG